MVRENRQLVTDEPVEFEKYPVEVEDCRKITHQFGGIYRINPNLIKENRRISKCNRLDLQTLGSRPIVPKNLPDDCPYLCVKFDNLQWAWCQRVALKNQWVLCLFSNLFMSLLHQWKQRIYRCKKIDSNGWRCRNLQQESTIRCTLMLMTQSQWPNSSFWAIDNQR